MTVMALELECPFCDHKFEVDNPGQEIVPCPNCGEDVMVPIYEDED